MPIWRASACSEGLPSTEPSGQTTKGNPPARSAYLWITSLASGLLGRIEQMVRNAVPSEKALEPDHIRRALRANENRAREPGLKQSHPAKNERPHDALAELGFGDQERTQTFGRNEQGLDVALCRAVRDRRAPGKLAGVSRELTRALFDDRRRMAQAVALGNSTGPP